MRPEQQCGDIYGTAAIVSDPQGISSTQERINIMSFYVKDLKL